MSYDHLPRAQALNLTLGSKLRTIRGIKVCCRHTEAFNQDDKDMIDEICKDAETRARKAFEDAVRELANNGSGTTSEQRQYTGK